MSAGHLLAAVLTKDVTAEEAEKISREILDLHAHELAEKIRAEEYIHTCCPECHAAAEACARLIDPEVGDG